MAARSVTNQEHPFTIGRDEFESLADDLRVVNAHADVLALLSATGDIDALHKESLTGMLLNMANQLKAIYDRLHGAVSAGRPEEEASHD